MSIKAFIHNEAIPLLDSLTEDSQAKWGMMGPQHMVEHLAVLFYIGRKEVVPLSIPVEKLEKVRAFINNDVPMAKEMKGVGLPKDHTPPLRYENLATAKEKFKDSVQAFYQFHENNPGQEITHPVFGKLDLDGWEKFHKKHIEHHFRQFGLMEEIEIKEGFDFNSI